jgi:hypothetical protein
VGAVSGVRDVETYNRGPSILWALFRVLEEMESVSYNLRSSHVLTVSVLSSDDCKHVGRREFEEGNLGGRATAVPYDKQELVE